MTTKRKYTKELLDEIIKRDNAILLGNYEKVSQSISISFKCNCDTEYIKTCRQLVDVSGAFCKECTFINGMNRKRKTCKEKFGYENIFQSPEIQVKIKETCKEKTGYEYASQSPEFQEKVKATNLKNLGVERPSQNSEVREKMKQKYFEKTGYDHNMKNPEVRQKAIETWNKNHGSHPFANPEVREKCKQTLIEIYNVDNPSKSKEIQDKKIETNLKNLGVEHPAQNPEVREKMKRTYYERTGYEYNMQNPEIQAKMQKKLFSFKDYICPSGNIRKVQGYEPFALDILFGEYEEEQIITDRLIIPIIKYNYQDKDKYYFPDIFIPHLNKIIEVKSTWTYTIEPDKILAKAEATKNEDYLYEIWIIEKNGNVIEKI